MGRVSLRVLVIGYIAVLVAAPVGSILWRAFSSGLGAAWAAVTTSSALHALGLTLLAVVVTVPVNAAFGMVIAILIARHRNWLTRILGSLVDLPLALSPVVVGLALLLAYGQTGWVGSWLAQHGIQVIFSWPGILLACAFVSLPYVVREVLPVLEEMGTDQEEAATSLGAGPWSVFWRVTLPSARVGLAYGVSLTTARVLGEIGAVTVVSGDILDHTQTMTVFIQDQYQNFQQVSAYAGAVVLALLCLLVFAGLTLMRRRAAIA
ncbi:MAG: sulfate ABC transporter permease subunit [Candidatus Dormiibacterota bacterium]